MHVCFILSIIPLCKNKGIEIEKTPQVNTDLYDKIIIAFIIVSIVPLYENLRHAISSYTAIDTSILAEVYEDKMYGTGVDVTWLSPIGKIGNSIDGVFIQFLYFTPFFFLTRSNINKYLLIGSFLPLINHVVFQFSVSGRTTPTMFVLNSIFLTILFRKFIPHKRMTFFGICATIVASSVFFAMFILTSARHEATNKDVDEAIVVGYYVAKGHVDFCEDLWNIKKHTEGDNSFGLAKKILLLPTPKNPVDYWTKNKTGVAPNLFYTYIGDWFMDFGGIITLLLFILVCVCSSIFFIHIRKRTTLVNIFFMFLYCEVLIMGWAYNVFKTTNSMTNLLFSIAMIYIINSRTKIKQIKNE